MKVHFDFTFKKYKIIEIYRNLKLKFLIISNTNNTYNKKNNIIKQLNNKKTSRNLIYLKNKVTNKAFTQIIEISRFKNFKTIISGPIFFIKLNNKINYLLNKKNLLLNNVLIFKLNNKIYSSKKILILNFLTYKENIILLFQLNITEIKKICKTY